MTFGDGVRPGTIEVVALGERLVSLVADDRGPLAWAERLCRFVAGAEVNAGVGLERLGPQCRVYIGRGSRPGSAGKAALTAEAPRHG